MGPPKNAVLGRFHLPRPCCRRISEKSAKIPPEGWSSGGGDFRTFFSKIGDNIVWEGEAFLKNWSKRGYPYFGHFLAILGISGENGVPDWPPRGCKPAEKTVHHPSWAVSEALPREYLGPGHPGSAKYTLGRASEMTHEGWCTVFFAGLHPMGDQSGTLFSPEIKIAKKCPK